MPALEAARLGDEIGHTNALAGLLIGAVAAAAIAVAAVAIVGTGGLAAVAIGAGIAAATAGGALGGASIGALIPTSPTGAILTGSPNVFVGSVALPAARAGLDTAACSGIIPFFSHATPLIAQGSSNVFINKMMAARRTDKLVCGATISKGCVTVFIGGGTATVPGLTIASEVPGWLTAGLWAVLIGGSIIATGGAVLAFGAGPAIGALLGGLAGSFLGGLGGGYIGEKIGGLFGNPELGERIGSVVGGFFGGLLGGIAGARVGGGLFPRGGTPPETEGGEGTPPEDQNTQQQGPDPMDDPAHLRDLGTDPRNGQFRQSEADAAQRLQQQVGPLQRDPTGDGDWLDQNGETYDAVGPVPQRFFNEESFENSIDNHLLKQGLNHVVVDLSGLDPGQEAAVRAYIASLPQADQDKIIILGG